MTVLILLPLRSKAAASENAHFKLVLPILFPCVPNS